MSAIQLKKMPWVDTSAIGRSRYLSFAVRNVLAIKWLPSGKLLHNYGKIHHFVAGKIHYFTIFNSKLFVYQRVTSIFLWFSYGFPMVFPWFAIHCAGKFWDVQAGRMRVPGCKGGPVLRCCLLMGVTAGLLRNPGVWIRSIRMIWIDIIIYIYTYIYI